MGALATVAVMWSAHAAIAKEATYTSYPYYVSKVSGPNQYPIDENWAENNTGKGVCSRIWEYLGGSSYNEVGVVCDSNAISVESFASCGINGHGTAGRYYAQYEYILSGYQLYNGCA